LKTRNLIVLLLSILITFLPVAAGCVQIVEPATETPETSTPMISLPTPTPTSPQATQAPAATTASPVPGPSPSVTNPVPTPSPTPTPVSRELCRGGDRVIILLVDTRLLSGISAGLEQFASDICKDGYTVIQRLSDFKNPSEVRSYLGQMYTETKGRLSGVIAIGDLPRAYQLVTASSSNPSIPPTIEEVISFQYYTDLNGTFGASPSYKSPGKHDFSYDIHTDDLNWEIWFGLLPLYKGDVPKTIQAINRYFAKNHAYRSGQSDIPRGYIEISEHFKSTSANEDTINLNYLRTGTYAWVPFSNGNNAHLYFDTKTTGLSLSEGYQALSTGIADFTVQASHGWYQASGNLTISWVESRPVKTIFFWSNGCAVGNLDYPDNFLTSILYSTTSTVLVAKGTTNASGGMGNNLNGCFGANIASAMTNNKSIGDAILYHVNVPLISPWSNSREFHFATTVVLGDPTLKLR
jgi:hypothetical protein